MSKVAGREQVFQLGVRYINDRMENEFIKVFQGEQWTEETKENIRKFVNMKYQELEKAMPFLQVHEYPRVSLYLESTGKLKLHVQGWMNNCKHCRLLGGMQYNRGTFYDFYVCMEDFNQGSLDSELIIRYGDEENEIYRRKSSEAANLGIKWRTINKLYLRGFDTIVSINPCESFKKKEVSDGRSKDVDKQVIG